MAPYLSIKSMAPFIIYFKSIAPFINFKSISITFEDFKYLIFSTCTIFLYVLFCVANLATFSLLILHFPLRTPTVHLNSVTITSLNTEAVNLTATFDLTFIFHSPIYNNPTVSYSNLKARVSWSGKDNITLASTTLPSFTQEARNMTVIRVELTMADGISNNSDVAIGICAERDSGWVKIGVNLFGSYKLKGDDSETFRFDFDPVYVKFPAGNNNGSWTSVVPRPILMHDLMV